MDGDFNISNLGIDLEVSNNLIDSRESDELNSFEQIFTDPDENIIQGKTEIESHQTISSNTEELEELVHFSEIG